MEPRLPFQPEGGYWVSPGQAFTQQCRIPDIEPYAFTTNITTFLRTFLCKRFCLYEHISQPSQTMKTTSMAIFFLCCGP